MDSMTRVKSGVYTYSFGGVEYRAEREVTRVSTGLTRQGRNETTWHVYRDNGLIADSETYGDARSYVMADAGKPPEQRASRLDKESPPEYPEETASQNETAPASHGDDPWEYDDGRGETAIGPPTSMEREHQYQ